MKRIKGGAAIDSILLTGVRVFTAAVSMVVAKMLAVSFSVEEYGIYSEVMLIVTTGTSVTILGLTDAINYFFNKEHDFNKKSKYVATIFSIQFIVGGIFAVSLFVFRHGIAAYFGDNSVISFLPYIAFMPLLNNLMNMLQVLFISGGRAKAIAVRNLVLSLTKIIYVTVVCFMVKDIKYILICLMIVDLLTVIYMWIYVKREIIPFMLRNANYSLSSSILSYSVPMAGFILTNALARNMDKFVVAKMANTATLAVYSIASKELPFDMLTAALVTVLIPYITQYIAQYDYDAAERTFSQYIKLCYLITWPIAFGAIINSSDLMVILYDKKYIVGLSIFILYILVDMIRFANVSIVFSAKAKTKELLIYSCSSLIANLILNIILFKIIGVAGPAISTVVVMFSINTLMLTRSSKLIESKLSKVLDLKRMTIVICECIAIGLVVLILNRLILWRLPLLIRFCVGYLGFIFPVFLMNYSEIVNSLRVINQLKMK